MKRFVLSDAKYPPDELAKLLAKSLIQDLEHILRRAEASKEIGSVLRQLSAAVEQQIKNHRHQIIVSPYSNVSDEAWAEAHEEAAEAIYEAEGIERDPTREEMDAALESINERRREERRHEFEDEHAVELGVGA